MCKSRKNIHLKVSGNDFESSIEYKKTQLLWNKAKTPGENKEGKENIKKGMAEEKEGVTRN